MSRRAEEKKLVEEFIKKSDIKGKYEVEKPIPKCKAVGSGKVVENVLRGLYSLRADIFITSDDGNYYIVEAKVTMNPSQLGQLLTYKFLLSQSLSIPEDKIKLIALCRKTIPELEPLFLRFNISVITL